MSRARDPHPRATRRGVVVALRDNGLVWLALIALLFASLALAYMPLGPWNTAVGLAISLAKTALVVAFFMSLGKGTTLLRLTAGAGLLFLCVMFALILLDVFSRG